jgi:hypothetical protein
MFCIIQLALIVVARQVVTYASFSAARSALVAETPGEAQNRASHAAALICSPITGGTVRGASVSPAAIDDARVEVPGWGEIRHSGISGELKTFTHPPEYPEPGTVRVTVTHYFELQIPIIGSLFAWASGRSGDRAEPMETGTGPMGTTTMAPEHQWEAQKGIWQIPTPHMRIRETTTLAAPAQQE